jgi:hypothetical protein
VTRQSLFPEIALPVPPVEPNSIPAPMQSSGLSFAAAADATSPDELELRPDLE